MEISELESGGKHSLLVAKESRETNIQMMGSPVGLLLPHIFNTS